MNFVVKAILLSSILLLFACQVGLEREQIISCDMENDINVKGEMFFKTNDNLFSNGISKSDQEAKSGKHSILLNKKSPFGATSHLVAKGGESYNVQVWRKTDFNIGKIVAEGKWGFYLNSQKAEDIDDNGWELLTMNFTIPDSVSSGNLKIYLWNEKNKDVYFDDLRIEINGVKSNMTQRNVSVDSVQLLISPKNWARIQSKKERALELGILLTEDDSWVKAKWLHNDDTLKCKVRLKGDWLDHIKDGHLSYRVKLKEGSFKGKTQFSVMHPRNRTYMSEWIFHQLLESEDVLTTSYEFIQVSVNGKSKGIYAFEEHFSKELLESRSRREAPILKFSEDALWMSRLKDNENDLEHGLTAYFQATVEGSEILPFKKNKTLRDSLLAKQFEKAKNMMQSFRFGKSELDDVIDLDKMARLFAVVDITNAYHGTVWHNLRFYFNPIAQKLEPIAFDGYTDNGPFFTTHKPFLGHIPIPEKLSRGLPNTLEHQFFKDPTFMKLYYAHLYRLTKKGAFHQFVKSLGKKYRQNSVLLELAYKNYTYDPAGVEDKMDVIRSLIFPGDAASVKIYKDGQKIRVANYHSMPIELVGTSATKDTTINGIAGPIVFPEWKKRTPLYTNWENAPIAKYYHYQIPGIDSTFRTEMKRWQSPQLLESNFKNIANTKLKKSNLYAIYEKQVVFKATKNQVKSDITIPKGYEVIIPAGCILDFLNGSGFVSYSPVHIKGSSTKPAWIGSTDKTGAGFTLMETKKVSNWQWAIFHGLKNLEKNAWQLTGAVSLYKSDLNAENVVFRNNYCEDALNTISSTVVLHTCKFENTFADAYDADFCKVDIWNTTVNYSGNDAFDFSGSSVYINECRLNNVGDKGISGGEASTIDIGTLWINKAVHGVVSKDFTQMVANKVFLYDCDTSFVTFIKKPTYDPPSMIIKAYESKGHNQLHKVNDRAFLSLVGDTITSSN